MSDAPDEMFVRAKPNGAMGRWHDATSLQETAEISSGGNNPMFRYIRADILAAALEREAALVEALNEISSAKANLSRSEDYQRGWTDARFKMRGIADAALAGTKTEGRG